jgi:uncharacterized OB-fold protein
MAHPLRRLPEVGDRFPPAGLSAIVGNLPHERADGPGGGAAVRLRREERMNPPIAPGGADLTEPISPATALAGFYAEGKLAFQVDPDGAAVWPPRLAAPGTGRPLEWRTGAGRGEVHATTVARPRGGEPYNLALIELDEGYRMMSRVVDRDPEEVRIGDRVEARFDDGLPVFTTVAS